MRENTSPSKMLGKSMALLEILAENGSPLSLKDLVVRTGAPKSSTHRQLAALVEERLVQFDGATRTYRIGYRFMSLAFMMWQNLDLRRAAIDAMRALSEEARENSHLAVLDGAEVVYVDRVEYHPIMRMHSAIGNRAPVHCVALGKAMVAFQEPRRISEILDATRFDRVAECTITDPEVYRRELETVRSQGFALAMREHQSDICGIAAPIRDFRNEVIAAVSLTVPAFRTEGKDLSAWGPRMIETAAVISRNLGWTG